MSHTIFHRSISLCLAAMLTLGMLGSIDHLAQRDPAPAGWAQTQPVTAPAVQA